MKSQRFNRQRGSGDSFAIIGVVVVCTAISVILMVLGWVKNTKDARIQRDFEANATTGPIKRGPHGYQVTY